MNTQPLTLGEARILMRSRGFVAVETAAGPVAIESWEPYGEYRRDTYRLELRPELNLLADHIPGDERRSGERRGVWRFLTAEEPAPTVNAY